MVWISNETLFVGLEWQYNVSLLDRVICLVAVSERMIAISDASGKLVLIQAGLDDEIPIEFHLEHQSIKAFLRKRLSFASALVAPVWIALEHIPGPELLVSLSTDFTLSFWNLQSHSHAWSFNLWENLAGISLFKLRLKSLLNACVGPEKLYPGFCHGHPRNLQYCCIHPRRLSPPVVTPQHRYPRVPILSKHYGPKVYPASLLDPYRHAER